VPSFHAVILRKVSWRTGLMLLLAAGGLCGLCGCGTPGPSANSAQGSQAAAPVPGSPFSVVATADGRCSFVTLNSAVEVLPNRSPLSGEMTVIPRTDTLLVTDYLPEQVQAVNLATVP
jgi:hypothetical protein